MEALDYFGLFGAIALLAVCIWWLNEMYKTGRDNAGKNKRVVFSLPHWASDPIVLYGDDKEGLKRVAQEYPSCRYQVFTNNKPQFKRFKHIKWLESDIQKGVI
jgi:hypothetical protein